MSAFDSGPLRVSIFLALLVCLLVAERIWPRRQQPARRRQRWLANFALQLVSAVLLRLLIPAAAVGFAVIANEQGYGVLTTTSWQLTVPTWLSILLACLLLDLAIYAQHVASHHWPWLWRLHRVHHSDTFIDTSTALRFHPLEILLSMLWKALLIFSLGPSVLAVILFEILLNGAAMFNHSNLALPLWLDRPLRWIIVTPDMHRVHHSVLPVETNSNYGFFSPWWDRLFGSYQAQPQNGHATMRIGLEQFRAQQQQTLPQLLRQPLSSAASDKSAS